MITIALFLALSLLARAATFAQRNLPTFVGHSSQCVSVSHLTDISDVGTTIPNAPVRKNSLLRNINFPDLTVTLSVQPVIERMVSLPSKILVSTFLSQPVRPPSC